ncbi:hypothetical protein [Burkholderia anthina]|uniref:Uncharacterized protein n=1 Tax=Burkholderia anthina TaxID=179879 RepID=A0AAW3PNR4_9BURK|nr:hypothetical protein WS64_30145 [Burkholderia anthina]
MRDTWSRKAGQPDRARHPRPRWHGGGTLPALCIDLTAWPDNATLTIDHPDGALVIHDDRLDRAFDTIRVKFRL